MRDCFINAVNIQKSTIEWMNAISENLTNLYTPGYRENMMTFKTYLDNAMPDRLLKNTGQGKAIPGTSPENVFLEGNGYFVLRNEEGRIAYTRLGEFKFDGDGVYRSTDGSKVQGYILNDKGEIMSGTKSLNNEIYEKTIAEGGALAIPTTEIKLWIDPDNGKYLGKYDEFEIKEDGVLYGKANNGKESTPLYKIALMNFHNPQELFEYKQGQYLETEYSGKPVIGKGEVRSGLLELSNIDFKANAVHWQEAQTTLNISGKIMSSYKSLLETAMDMIK
ncbi:flagellar hook basal-body protein [bacterium]|nr:flagellar hook basal-body protein [bacterium]